MRTEQFYISIYIYRDQTNGLAVSKEPRYWWYLTATSFSTRSSTCYAMMSSNVRCWSGWERLRQSWGISHHLI